jgi:ribosomal protein L1
MPPDVTPRKARGRAADTNEPLEDAALIAAAQKALAEAGPFISSEDLRAELDLDREVGTVVEEVVLPFEVRKDGSIAYFTQEHAAMVREVGS